MGKRISHYFRSIFNLLRPNEKASGLYSYFNESNEVSDGFEKRNAIMVQCVEDVLYYGLFGQLISKIKVLEPVRVDLFVLNSLRLGESRSFFCFLRSIIVNRLLCRKWVGLYKVFSDKVGYRSVGCSLVHDLHDLYLTFLVKKKIKTKDDLIGLVISEILVGDLINDAYLRFKPAPTVDLSDIYLFYIIFQGHREIRRATKYFQEVSPDLYLTSYSTYIQHGIAVRVALREGIEVRTLYSNRQEFSKILNVSDCSHTKNTKNYASQFSKIASQAEKLKEADVALSSRLNGVVDAATSYMKKSAYVESIDLVPDVQGSLVVFLHDFFDSPHVYRSMVFPDFWEWICFTIERLQSVGIRFFLKPHPNQVEASDTVIAAVKERYPSLLWVPAAVTNKQLVQAGMVCAVTVYGTVAHEMAYLGVPTIACGDHPHMAFDFCRTATTKDEYAKLLERYAIVSLSKDEMRRQSLIFYYMHNLNMDPDEKRLLVLVNEYAKLCEDPSASSEDIVNALNLISSNIYFENYVENISRILK